MEFFCITLLHSLRIGRAQSLPKGEVLGHQPKSEDTRQQVGTCSTAMVQDGREILHDADTDCAQEMRATLIAHTSCYMEDTQPISQQRRQIRLSGTGELFLGWRVFSGPE